MACSGRNRKGPHECWLVALKHTYPTTKQFLSLVEVKSLWHQTFQLKNPTKLPLFSLSGVVVMNFLYSHHLQVLDTVVRQVEVGCYWLIQFLGLDIRAVAIEADVCTINRLADIYVYCIPHLLH